MYIQTGVTLQIVKPHQHHSQNLKSVLNLLDRTVYILQDFITEKPWGL